MPSCCSTRMDCHFEEPVVVDTSALIAVLLGEEEEEEEKFMVPLAKIRPLRMSAASYFEAAIIADRRGDAVTRAVLDSFLEEFSIQVEPVTFDQVKLARQAYDRFGKGRHPAGLNYADCFSYALAKSLREPLLFKGNDFSKTDLVNAAGEPRRSSWTGHRNPGR